MSSRGFFVTFEGLDGSGKSTQCRKLEHFLRGRGESVVATRQPGGTELGDRIRALLLDSRNGDAPAPMTELGLMFSDRAQTIAEVIRPALDAGSIVLCDRFTDSTEAYQGAGRGLGSAPVLALHAALCGGLQPDLTILLLPHFEHSLQRARRRNARAVAATGQDENRFEALDTAFFQRVFDHYREIARREPFRVVTIEGDAPVAVVHQRIVTVITERLAAQRPLVSA